MELHNNHNVYILGAGFSRERNYPLVSDFLNRMRDAHPWLEGLGRKAEADAIQEIINFRLDSASAGYRISIDLENIEDLFSLASAMPNSRELMDNIRLAIAATIDFCQQTEESPHVRIDTQENSLNIPSQLVPNSRGQTPQTKLYQASLYDTLVGLLTGRLTGNGTGENTFISFNYDTLVEDALHNSGVSWTYDFSSQIKQDNYAKQIANNRHLPNGQVPVYKLHGSVNWAYTKGIGKGFTLFSSYDDIREQELIPELIPPTWRKVFDRRLSEVWDGAIKSLTTATRVIIIGFSIPETDMHFKHLIAAGLKDNVSLRSIFFCSPDAGLKERSQKVFKETIRCEHRNMYTRALLSDPAFLEYIGRPLPDNVRFFPG